MVVIKAGGSLLEAPEFKSNLENLIKQLDEPVALVVGGGEFVNSLRRLHEFHQLTEEQSHWRALELMSITAKILSAATGFPLVGSWDEISERLAVGQVVIVDVISLSGIETLEQTWNVTSDTLSAWIAKTLSATRLILAKSKPLTQLISLEELAQQGEVDSSFPRFARRLPVVEWCCLRTVPNQMVLQRTPIFSQSHSSDS